MGIVRRGALPLCLNSRDNGRGETTAPPGARPHTRHLRRCRCAELERACSCPRRQEDNGSSSADLQDGYGCRGGVVQARGSWQEASLAGSPSPRRKENAGQQSLLRSGGHAAKGTVRQQCRRRRRRPQEGRRSRRRPPASHGTAATGSDCCGRQQAMHASPERTTMLSGLMIATHRDKARAKRWEGESWEVR